MSLAAGTNLSVMSVSTLVQPSAVVKFVVVPINISISAADIARGYIDVPVGSLLSIKSGQALPPVIIDFSMGDGVFKSVEIREPEPAKPQSLTAARRTDLGISSGDASVDEQSKKTPGEARDAAIEATKKTVGPAESGDAPATDRNTAAFAYRFRLSDKARPGSYQVPLVVNVTF